MNIIKSTIILGLVVPGIAVAMPGDGIASKIVDRQMQMHKNQQVRNVGGFGEGGYGAELGSGFQQNIIQLHNKFNDHYDPNTSPDYANERIDGIREIENIEKRASKIPTLTEQISEKVDLQRVYKIR